MMKTKVRTGLALLFCAFMLGKAEAQPYNRQARYEVGGWVGASLYNGDLTDGFASTKTTRLGTGIFTRVSYGRTFSFRIGGDFAKLAANDVDASSSDRKARRLNFHTDIWDAYFVPEVTLVNLNKRNRMHPLRVFAFAGVGVFKFNPKAVFNRQTYVLQPLGTEGQTLPGSILRPYELVQAYYPFGLGLQYRMGYQWNIGFEFRANKTFTDYLDDASSKDYVSREDFLAHGKTESAQLADPSAPLGSTTLKPRLTGRANPNTYDWFYFTGVTVSYSIMKPNCYKF